MASNRMAAMLLVRQAMAAAEVGRYDEAVHLLTQAIQMVPDSGEIYHNRGMAYSKMQHWREALVDFNRAITLDPHPTSYEQRGLVYYQLGDRQAARQDFLEILRVDSQRVFPLINLGWLCIEDKRYQEAIGYLTHAIAIEPTSAAAYSNRARAYLEMGDRVHAFADLQKAKHLVESGMDTSDQDFVE